MQPCSGCGSAKRTYLDNSLSRYGTRISLVLVDKYMHGHGAWKYTQSATARMYLLPGIMEHVDRAGVHSSGATPSPYTPPAPNPSPAKAARLVHYDPTSLALAYRHRSGLINIQYVVDAEDQRICHRGKPSFLQNRALSGEVTGIPMVDIATRVVARGQIKGYALRHRSCPDFLLHRDQSACLLL